MHLVFKSAKRWLPALAGALIAAGVGVVLHQSPFGRPLRYASYDLLHIAQGNITATNAVMIYMDEVSYRTLNQPLNAPWDRTLHARLVDRLTAAGAKAIAFDVIFSDPAPDGKADIEFARAIKQSGRVVLAADNVLTAPGMHQMMMPVDALRDVAAAIGSAETIPDTDVTIRRHTPEDVLPTLSDATARLAAPAKYHGSTYMWMHYYGPPDWLPAKSYYEVLENSAPDAFFRDKTVFIGARLLTKFAGERKDEYRNPYSAFAVGSRKDQKPLISGVEIQATAFLNFARGDWLERLSGRSELAFLIVFGIATGAGLLLLRPTMAVLVAVAAAIAVGIISYITFRRQLVWFPWMLAMTQTGTALAYAIVYNSIQLYVQKRLYEQTLARYLSPKLVRKFSKEPSILDRPAHKQTVTLLFSDIANFTSMSEGVDSDQLRELMNNYFETAVSQCIHRCDGTVVKYIGDSIFAFWNAPDEQGDHALRACEAALRFRDASFIWIDSKRVRTRIGIHTGIANVGNFGSSERYDYTALGENVNLASRIEGLNKYLGTNFLISRATYDGLAGQLPTRELGSFRLKGFEKPVQVFELVGWPSELAAAKFWADSFAEAVTLFRKGSLEKAAQMFRRTLELHADDGPSKFYLDQIERIISEPPSGEWTGDVELTEK